MSAMPVWQKSSFSGSGDGNNCVEVAAFDDDIRLRESDDAATDLAVGSAVLAAMLRYVKSADFTPRS